MASRRTFPVGMAPTGLARRALNVVTGGLGFRADATSVDLNDPRLWGLATQSTAAGVTVTPDTVTQLDTVQAVLNRLAGTLSTVPLMLYERLDPDTDANDIGDALTTPGQPSPRRAAADPRQVLKTHPLWKMLRRRPNRRQTAQEFWAEMNWNLALWRNCYAEIVPADNGHPVGALWPIHPNRISRIERRPANDPDGRVWYLVASLDRSEWDRWIPEDRIFHVRMAPLRKDGLAGIPVFESASEIFGRAIAVETFGALYFANGGSGGGVLKHPGNFKTTEDRDRFLEAWRAGGTGMNRHKDRLLLFGLDYTPFKVDNDEAQFIDTLRETAVKICRLWNMPPHLVGILDRATFSNIEQQSIEFVQHTIAPQVAAIEQAVNRDLIVGDDQDRLFVEFNLEGLLRGDFQSRMNGYAQGRQWGWLSVNDIRARENLAPIGPAGDIYLTPLNMTDAADPDDAPGQGPNADDAADGTELPDDEDDDEDPEPAPPAPPPPARPARPKKATP